MSKKKKQLEKKPTPAPAKATEDKNKFKVLHGGLPTNYLEIFERWFAVGKKAAAGLARCADENGVGVRDLINTMPEKLADWKITKFSESDIQTAESILHEISANISNRVKNHNDSINAKLNPTAEVEYTEPGRPERTAAGDVPKRKKWNEYPITAVVRWMGVEGWNAKQATQVLEALGFDLSPATIAAQLRAGKMEERGPAADLNPQQEKELNKLLK